MLTVEELEALAAVMGLEWIVWARPDPLGEHAAYIRSVGIRLARGDTQQEAMNKFWSAYVNSRRT